MSSSDLEEGNRLQLDFDKLEKAVSQSRGIIPAAVQNVDTREVILVAYVNREALDESVRTRVATFWSTSRNELWVKGKTSGHFFEVVEIRVNCEQNSDRKSTRLNSSHSQQSRMPSSA